MVWDISQSDSLHRQGFADFLLGLKIEIAGGLLSNPRKNWTGHESTIIQLGLVRMRIVQHDEPDKFWMVSRKITDEGNNILPFFVATFGIDLLGRASFPSNGEAGNSGGGGGAAITHDTAQRVADLSGCLGRNYLAQNDRRKRAERFAIHCGDGFHHTRSD